MVLVKYLQAKLLYVFSSCAVGAQNYTIIFQTAVLHLRKDEIGVIGAIGKGKKLPMNSIDI